jgi:peptidoglycan hydrolase-like protein with peptidoglycan-binding domain
MALKFPPFAACKAMEQAAKSAPALRKGSRGPAVSLLQGALIQLGAKMPKSIKKGAPDGAYGSETESAVIAFQIRAKVIPPNGVAGSQTIKALDAEMVKNAKPIPPSPPPPPVLPTTPHYEVGSGDPPLRHDAGAGMWKSKPWEVSYLALKEAIIQALPTAYVVIGADATKHMIHYLNNSGANYTIDLEGMVKDVPSAYQRYLDEVAQAQELVEQLAVGKHTIHSRKAENGYNRQAESRNWFFAIGGYTKWGHGTATVKTDSNYELEFEYKFYDRYNWDAGKSVTFAGIKVTDQFMGEFHRQGLAKEFDCYGSFKRRFIWKKGDKISKQQLDTPIGGR